MLSALLVQLGKLQVGRTLLTARAARSLERTLLFVFIIENHGRHLSFSLKERLDN